MTELEKKFQKLGRGIDELNTKIEKKVKDTMPSKKEIKNKYESLLEEKEKILSRLKKVKNVSVENWEDLRGDIEKSIHTLENTINELRLNIDSPKHSKLKLWFWAVIYLILLITVTATLVGGYTSFAMTLLRMFAIVFFVSSIYFLTKLYMGKK